MEESAWKNICISCNHKAGRKNNLSIQMTPKQRRKANALIRKSCCNYDGAIVLRWMMASFVSVYRASLILCVVPGSGIGFCRVLRLYKLKSPVPKDWSNAQNVVRRFWQNPTVPSIVPIVPARYTAVRKQQVTGNGGRIRTNRASKSRIYARFPAWQSWRWIAIYPV